MKKLRGFGSYAISGSLASYVKHLIYRNTNPLNLKGKTLILK
jgi:hypothetical protein